VSKASGVTPTITPSVANVSSSGSIAVAYTTSGAMAIGSTIALTYNSSYTGTVSTANTTINAVAPSAVSVVTAGSNKVATLTLAATVTSGATVTISTSALTTPVAAGNYVFSIKSSVNNDTGANFQYVGEANAVQVRAFIPISLSFDIRNNADTANTNTCDLGTLTTTAVSTCDYRLKVSTNAKGGYTISAVADGDLTDGTNPIVNAAVGTGGTGGTAITAGTESYGVTIGTGSITGGGTISLASAYNAGATNAVKYNNTTAAVVLTATKPNSPATSGDVTNTSLVTHKIAISGNTEAGSYTQKITYTVSPSF
jgi:hypothetical protein